MSKSVGFIGVGQMASAMMKGFSSSGIVLTENMLATDVNKFCLSRLTELNVRAAPNNRSIADDSDVLFLAVKPHIIPSVLREIAPNVSKDKLIVSVAAGVNIATMESILPPGSKVIRVMPNTPCSVGCSASAYAAGTYATEQDMDFIGELLNSVGLGIPCNESEMNGITALSGSGPAYVFLMIEAMADAGVKGGVPRDMALKLAAHTVAGAAQMVIQTGTHPAVLKDRVCSPAGTTIAGVTSLETHGFRNAVISAVTAAKARADELTNN